MSKKGFTLIEITIVIAIIGVLVTIAIAAGSAAKAGARDNQRKTDIKLLQVKLETYREMEGSYPTTLYGGSNSLVSSGIISVPVSNQIKDPTGNNGGYQYFPLKFSGGDCSVGSVSYYLFATLENNSSAQSAVINSSLVPCSGNLPATTTKTYDVTSPI